MRCLFVALAVALSSGTPVAAAPMGHAPAPVQAVATPQGGFRLGSATAPVQLIEYASLACPHCREFHQEGWAALKRDYIDKGLVAIEVRNMVLNGPDVVATLLARCDGPSAFFRRVDVFYDHQDEWLAPYVHLTKEQSDSVAKLPMSQRLIGVARVGHLAGFAAGKGMVPARITACLTSPAGTARLDALGKLGNSQGVTGTPTFFLNGRKLDTNSWSGVEGELRSALKK